MAQDCLYIFGWPIRETAKCAEKRRAQKAHRQDQRQDARGERVETRQEEHSERVDTRQEGKSDRTDTRQDERTNRTNLRGKYGIDPLGDLFGSLGGALSGAGCALAGIGCPQQQAQPAAPDITTPLLAVGGVAVVGGLLYVALR